MFKRKNKKIKQKPEGKGFIIENILREEIYLKFLKELNTDNYLRKNKDLEIALKHKIIPDLDTHFRDTGIKEIYKGTRILYSELKPYSNEKYLRKNPYISNEIGKNKTYFSAFEHYLLQGHIRIMSGQQKEIEEEINVYLIPNILRKHIYIQFLAELDKVAYLKKNADLMLAIENGSVKNVDTHFVEKGLEEIYSGNRILMDGLVPYNETTYLMLNQDIEAHFSEKGFVSGFEYFLLYGYKEVLDGIRQMTPEVKIEQEEVPPFELNRMVIEKSGLFDSEFYRTEYKDIANQEIDPLMHYLLHGAEERRDPSAHFSTSYYLSQYPEVLQSGINPLVHYVLAGKEQKRKTFSTNLAAGTVTLLDLPLVEKPLEPVDLKIAVVIHAFYIDVLEDIITAIDYIDPKPDLFISVAEDADIEEIKRFLAERGYHNVAIKAVQNRGRDVAPFLAEFAQALKGYDLCCKIHGKKSLYGGSEQTNWRNHLYHNLLGSKEIVDDIINAFSQNKKLGLLFSDNFGMIPYWGYSWLTNKGVVNGLLHRLNLTVLLPILEQTYIDYPAGTMFWFRPEAIAQILDSGISYEDFPEEPIGNDGTIAHGLERLFGYVTRLNGYDYIEQNRKRMKYSKNVTHKNFNQHEAKTLDTAKRIVSEKECIIFDIFDTLVTRTIFYPDNLFRIMEEEFDKKFGIKSDFMRVRKETEYQLRISEAHTGDVSYEDIYDHLHLHSDYSKEMIDYLREKDFACELEILIPKPEVIALLKYAYDQNIDILFVSDMYLTKKQILAILEKQNIPFKEENVLVSSDTGYRKDNTSIWKHLVDTKRIDPSKTLMIGDSEVSDAKLPGDFAIGTFHILSERNTFFESPFGKAFQQQFGTVSETDMLLLGPVVNQLFASPFALSETVLSFSKKCTPYTFGYTALAPFFYMFITHLYQKFSDNKIYFLARDGYFIKEAFEHMLKSKGLSLKSETAYLQISRRAMLGAVIKTEENLKNMILNLGNYDGMFSAMLYSRVGLDAAFLEECGIEDFEIKDVTDLEKAYEVLLEHLDEVNAHTRAENEAYMAYLDSIDFFKESEDVLVDLGYSGTIQNYLHQLSGEKLIGEYFVTTEKVSAVEGAENVLEGYFADKIDPADNSNIVYKYALILEAFLTSDKGQLICFKKEEGKIIPQYKEKHESLAVQREIMRGIRDYISALSIVPVDFMDAESERLKAISLFSYEYMLQHRLLDEELMGIFHLEDEFTGNKALDILSILNQRGI